MARRLRRRSRKTVTRIALRIMARRNPDSAEEIRQILADPDMLDMAVAWASEGHERSSRASDSDGGPLLNFLDWLINNGPAFLEFLVKLIAIFGI